jgi:hypothetical protein
MVMTLLMLLGGKANAATPEATEAAEPAVSLVWFIIGGFVFAVLAGGGLAELIKLTLLARWKQQAEEQQKRTAEEADADVSEVSKPWWWVSMLGATAMFVGAVVLAIAAPFLDYPAGLGFLIGGGGGVNATWLWQPVQRAVKGIVGALKGKFSGGGDEPEG